MSKEENELCKQCIYNKNSKESFNCNKKVCDFIEIAKKHLYSYGDDIK